MEAQPPHAPLRALALALAPRRRQRTAVAAVRVGWVAVPAAGRVDPRVLKWGPQAVGTDGSLFSHVVET